jgi:protein gp37
MYPWVSHTHAHLGGECPHKCTYCYVDSFRQRVPKYQGKLRLIESQLKVNYGRRSENYPNGKTIFIENCNDLFAEDVPMEFIDKILHHCHEFPDNTYVFQTKNPRRLKLLADDGRLPIHSLCGITIETNRNILNIGNAPLPVFRIISAHHLIEKKFITIEPILDFDVVNLSNWIKYIKPDFVNIGADSKGHGLEEPTMEKVQALIDKLNEYGIEIREKSNLERLRAR